MVFYKYNASGNIFAIFHTFVKKDYSNLAKQICSLDSGIGADGLVVVLPNEKYAYEWDFYNSDGSRASMCGNASRSVGHYAVLNNLAESSHSFLSGAGEIKLEVTDFSEFGAVVSSNMGAYKEYKKLDSTQIKEVLKDSSFKEDVFYLNTGVPHIVIYVENLESIDLDSLKALREAFNANVNLVRKLDSTQIKVVTYERGVEAITGACGTGMAASFVVGFKELGLESKIRAYPPSKETLVLFLDSNEIYLQGLVKNLGFCNINGLKK